MNSSASDEIASADPGVGGHLNALSDEAAARFPDEAHARGLVWRNESGSADKRVILEANGAGAALFDLGNDGDLDVVLAQGVASIQALLRGPGASLGLFENKGAGRFERAPEDHIRGEGLRAWWTGIAAGDLDGDGDTDLVAGAFGDLAVLRQTDAGVLERVEPRQAGLWPSGAFKTPGPGTVERSVLGLLFPGAERPAGGSPLWHTSSALFDADRDGHLDLYVGRYLSIDPSAAPPESLGDGALALPCTWKGLQVYCGPRGLEPQADSIYRGNGDGTFRERNDEWLPNHEAGFSLAVTAFDADMDGDTDLHVANDSVPDLLLWNSVTEGGGFRDIGSAAGIAVNPDGLSEAGMGAAIGDLDRDGRFDLAVTNFSDEPTQLYLALPPRSQSTSDAPQRFRNISYSSGLASKTRRQLSWSAHLVDFDLDTRLELFVANGHVYPQADQPGTGTSYGQADALFSFDGNLKAQRTPLANADAFHRKLGTRGVAAGDLDGDGATDLVLSHIDAPVALAMNRSAGSNHRLVVRCEGAPPASGTELEAFGSGEEERQVVAWRTPRDAMGTRVICVPTLAAGATQFALLQEVQTSRGFQSASSPDLTFGLGSSNEVGELTFLWPSGRVETLRNVQAGQRIVVREGAGIVSTEELR